MSALTAAIAPYSTLELTAMMTSSLVAALLVIALAFRIISAVASIREYEEACEKVRQIESKMQETEQYIAALEQQYESDLDALKQEHAKERFDLQQLVFTRNSEILSLKNTLIEMSKTSQTEQSY